MRLKPWVDRVFDFLNKFGRIPPTIVPVDQSPTPNALISDTEARVRKILVDAGIELLEVPDHQSRNILVAKASNRPEFLRDIFSGKSAPRYGLVCRASMARKGRKIEVRIQSKLAYRAAQVLGKLADLERAIFYSAFTDDIKGKARIGLEFGTQVYFAEVENGWLEIYGEQTGVPCVEVLADSSRPRLPYVNEITFPIDIVYTWVNGFDAQWETRRQQRLRSIGAQPMPRANNRSRWESRDELLYSLRSVALFAPWVRNIFLVTDQQVPTWLNQESDGRLKVIDHRDIFPEPKVLPVFNSHAIESCLHRIEGLSECFLYMNDDVFLLTLTAPENFFTPSGQSKAFYSSSLLPQGSPEARERASEWGGMNASRLLQSRFGVSSRFKTKHTPFPVRRSTMYELEDVFSEAFAKTRESPFRAVTDIAPISALHLNYSVFKGSGVPGEIPYTYVDIGSPRVVELLDRAFSARRYKVVCLNDTDEVEGSLSWEERERLVKTTLSTALPWPSPWEDQEFRED